MSSDQPLFAILKTVVESRAGLHYAADDKELFMSRVTLRATDAGFSSLLDYYYFLRYDPDGARELERLIDALVINETFFFRELAPVRVAIERLVVPLIEAGHRPRIWSAACSTGEEPYTVAMLLAEAGLLEKVELIASDVSTRALERAQSALFSRRSLREPSHHRLAAKWVFETPKGLTIDPLLRDAIIWQRINLCDPAPMPPASCDVIFCRNVLIYFSDETVARVVQMLTHALKPQGALFVGISESLLRFGTALECQELDQVFVYRKPA